MACVSCGCKQHVANRFQPDKCATCLHNHTRNINPTPAPASPSVSGGAYIEPRTPPPPTRKTPTPKASPRNSPTPKARTPSPTPRKKEEAGMWEKMKGDFLEMKGQVVDKVSDLAVRSAVLSRRADRRSSGSGRAAPAM